MRPVDATKMRAMEVTAREVGNIIGTVAEHQIGGRMGFLLCFFDFEGPEFTYICNADRVQTIEMLKEMISKLEDGSAEGLWDAKKVGKL